ncbi:MAG: M3 family metallopeptidase, partial [Bacteriovoracales bacterium]|nr:M3 family metallopeptidase [Bacteriovoracales bacterium]
MKIFFEEFKTPFKTLPFGKWKIEDYLPAVKKAMRLAKERIEVLKNSSKKADFDHFLSPYLESTKELDLISRTFFNLHSAHTCNEMEKAAGELSPLLSAFSNDLFLDAKIFEQLKMTYDKREEGRKLTVEEKTILEDEYKTFVRNGALLSEEKKRALREVDEQLAKLQVQFGKNALKAKNQYVMPVTKDDLDGIPEDNLEIFRNVAKEKGLSGHAVTFDFSVYMPFMQGCKKRALREKVYTDYVQSATDGEFDNRSICKDMISLRKKRAGILGYPDHATFVLERRMAESSQEVMDFLDEFKAKALKKAQDEMKELSAFAKEMDSIDRLMPWDFYFYSEKYKKQLFDFDDDTLRPYFPLESVVQGVFETALRLYGIRFKENNEIPTYHQDVTAYEVWDDRTSKICGIFYADFFPRSSKRQGAWMCNYRKQSQEQIPHVAIVCNFTKPVKDRPSLLTHGEVLTLFHEFGHALHGLLSKCRYSALSGPQVYWDFVELPSQLMENWAFEKECLDIFAKHYKTKETIPRSLLKKIKESQSFFEGHA